MASIAAFSARGPGIESRTERFFSFIFSEKESRSLPEYDKNTVINAFLELESK